MRGTGRPNRFLALVPLGFAVTAVLLALALLSVLLSGTDQANTSAPGYLPLAFVATAVLLAAVGIAAFVRRADVRLARPFPIVVGVVSLVVSLLPWWALFVGNADLGSRIYQGLRVPQGIMQFWDMSLVMQSIDCAAVGVDVFQPNNGCLQDPAIYAPGMLWLQYVPFDIFSARYATGLGVGAIIVSSLFLAWLARRSTGLGQIVLLVAAVGGPWLLLLERGNIDAAMLWGAGLVVVLVGRWNALWAWSLAAAAIWLLGTWKYYPFAMGLMLVPVLRLRRGWTVLAGYAVATLLFLALTWDNFRFSSQSNANMIDYGDFVVLGRVPVVARMLGTVVGQSGLQAGDLLVFALALAAVVWGAFVGLGMRRLPVSGAMLAVAGSALFLSSVLVAGFGWGYKATFLLLGVPLAGVLAASKRPALVSSGVLVLALTGITAVVVWNTVLATLAGVVVAGFLLGCSGAVIVRSLRSDVRTAAPATA